MPAKKRTSHVPDRPWVGMFVPATGRLKTSSRSSVGTAVTRAVRLS